MLYFINSINQITPRDDDGYNVTFSDTNKFLHV